MDNGSKLRDIYKPIDNKIAPGTYWVDSVAKYVDLFNARYISLDGEFTKEELRFFIELIDNASLHSQEWRVAERRSK